MTKNKLDRFAEMATYPHVVQPAIKGIFQGDYKYKGRWNIDFFKNNNPIIIELGCGKGEYTVGLASANPHLNYIGVDIKGARMWKGAKAVWEEKIKNVGFLRTRIEFITLFFNKNEIDVIWITFPDPQPKKAKKRLTSSRFLNYYKNFLKPEGIVHLKTDNAELYNYTRLLIKHNKLPVLSQTDNLYAEEGKEEAKLFQTFYEKKYLNEGIPIKYIRFKLNSKPIEEPGTE